MLQCTAVARAQECGRWRAVVLMAKVEEGLHPWRLAVVASFAPISTGSLGCFLGWGDVDNGEPS